MQSSYSACEGTYERPYPCPNIPSTKSFEQRRTKKESCDSRLYNRQHNRAARRPLLCVRPTEPAAIPALDRVSGEDVRVAPSKCYRGMVSDKDGPRARFLHVALTIKLSRQIYARLGELGKTMLTLHREWFSEPRRTKVGKGCRSQRRTIGQRPVQHSG